MWLQASAPYLKILERWIYKGVIEDPFAEFMVEEEAGIHKDRVKRHYNDMYWEQRYTLVPERTPNFLEKLSDKIMRTGKYLNVMRESGCAPRFPEATDLMYQLRERAYVDAIEGAFEFASRSLLDMLNTDLKLMDRLTSLKNYFCMNRGDFFSHLLDTAETELKKLVRDIAPSRLDALLEMALRVSSASHDPFKDDLKCALVPHNLITELFRIMNVTHSAKGKERGFVKPEEMALDGPDTMAGSTLTGLEALTFEYDVRWPVSLVISRKSLKRYQLIFRHFLHCRHVERMLCRTWLSDQKMKGQNTTGSWHILAFALRQRMLNFVQSFQYYMMFEVIERNWHIMAGKLKEASTIDDVLNSHNNFLDTCLKQCMLTNPDVLKTISKLLSVCSIFSNSMERIATDAAANRSGASTPRRLAAGSDKHANTVRSFDNKFSGYMDQLLDSLTAFSTTANEAHMSNMIARLDFNGYYAATRSSRQKSSRQRPPAPPQFNPSQPPAQPAQPAQTDATT